MTRKELEDQMRNILIPVAPHGWLIDRCCDLAELYAKDKPKQTDIDTCPHCDISPVRCKSCGDVI